MGITFKELKAKLIGELDVIPASSAGDRINDALRDIYDEVEWGFLFTEGYIRTPALIDGYASAIQFEDKITLDVATKALVDAIGINQVPFEERQIRQIGSKQVDRGFTYNILDYDSVTGEVTLDPPFQDETNSAIHIQILKIYYTAPYFITRSMGVDPDTNDPIVINSEPIIDFKRFEYVVSPQFNRRLILDATPAELFFHDPYREYAAEPRFLVSHSQDSAGNRLYEMYPAPRFERLLRVRYLRAGVPLIAESDQIPDALSKELVITKAKMKSYEWAMANADKLNLKSVGRFQNLIAMLNSPNMPSGYPQLLEKAKKNDEEAYPKAYQGNFADVPYYDWELGGECMGETLLLNF
jgi:hypothetical protein